MALAQDCLVPCANRPPKCGGDGSPLPSLSLTSASGPPHVVVGSLIGGAAVSAAAMVLSPGVATFVMGGVCLANVPYAMAKEWRIGALPALRDLTRKMRADAARLEGAVDALAAEVDALGPEAARVAETEEELRSIAQSQEINVDTLVDLVKENEVMLCKMRDNLRQRVFQDVISIVVKSDHDNNQIIDGKEAKELALRIHLALHEYGVFFDSEKFLWLIGRGTTVRAVLALIQKLLPMEGQENAEGDSDWDKEWDDESDIEEDCIYDMFHMFADCPQDSDASEAYEGERVSLVMCDRPSHRRRSRRTRRQPLLTDIEYADMENFTF